MLETACPECKKPFYPRDFRQKCCSKKCGAAQYDKSPNRYQNNKKNFAKNKTKIYAARQIKYATDESYRNKIVEQTRKRREENPEHIRQINARYRVKPENRVAAANKSREWHAVNKERANPRRIMRKQKERNIYPWKGPLDAARRRASEKKLPFTLTEEWAKSVWTGRCALSGIPFRIGARGNGPKFFAASIDQIKPKQGYTQDNARFILWAVNAFKYDGTDENVFEVAEAIMQNRPRQYIEGILALPG